MADPASLQDHTSVEAFVLGEHACDPHLQESAHNDRVFSSDMLEDFDISVQFDVHVVKKALGNFQVFQMVCPIQCIVAMLSFDIDVGSQAQQALDFGKIIFHDCMVQVDVEGTPVPRVVLIEADLRVGFVCTLVSQSRSILSRRLPCLMPP